MSQSTAFFFFKPLLIGFDFLLTFLPSIVYQAWHAVLPPTSPFRNHGSHFCHRPPVFQALNAVLPPTSPFRNHGSHFCHRSPVFHALNAVLPPSSHLATTAHISATIGGDHSVEIIHLNKCVTVNCLLFIQTSVDWV